MNNNIISKMILQLTAYSLHMKQTTKQRGIPNILHKNVYGANSRGTLIRLWNNTRPDTVD